MLPTIPETDLDGVNIQAKMLNFLRHLVEENNQPKLVMSEDLDNSFYFYRMEVLKMIQNNKTTLDINYSHLVYTDESLSQVVYFYYYKVSLISTKNSFWKL